MDGECLCGWTGGSINGRCRVDTNSVSVDGWK